VIPPSDVRLLENQTLLLGKEKAIPGVLNHRWDLGERRRLDIR
jgi:hypothetical protein